MFYNTGCRTAVPHGGSPPAGGGVKFPYVAIGRKVYAPMVPVEVWTGNRWLWVEAYVDSGASSSIFHAEVGELIKPALNRPHRIQMGLGDGRIIPVNIHHVRVRFGGKEFLAPIGFSAKFWTRFNLLGRAGFFERFRITFHERAKFVETTEIK